jgi:hypothetical protein
LGFGSTAGEDKDPSIAVFVVTPAAAF